jgi:protein-S-isoprenylcysteine O-methyltransferase Ste14
MYLGVLLVVLGWATFFGTTELLWYAAVVALAFHLFVLGIEEPILRHKFGEHYTAYCRSVSRWIPGRPYPVTERVGVA